MAVPQPTQKLLLGDPAEILPGRSKSYRVAGKDIIVVNVGDHVEPDGHVTSGLRGYVNFCTHMGGKVRCIGERFECDWHGSQFDCRTGAVVDGVGGAPLGSDLEKIEMVIEGDKMYWMYTPKKSPWAME